MKAIRELIDYFITRGTFTDDEIRRMKDLGYLKSDEQEASPEEEGLSPDEQTPDNLTEDDSQSLEDELLRKCTLIGFESYLALFERRLGLGATINKCSVEELREWILLSRRFLLWSQDSGPEGCFI